MRVWSVTYADDRVFTVAACSAGDARKIADTLRFQREARVNGQVCWSPSASVRQVL